MTFSTNKPLKLSLYYCQIRITYWGFTSIDHLWYFKLWNREIPKSVFYRGHFLFYIILIKKLTRHLRFKLFCLRLTQTNIYFICCAIYMNLTGILKIFAYNSYLCILFHSNKKLRYFNYFSHRRFIVWQIK